MNKLEKELIRSVCKDNLYYAKQYARKILSENKARSNQEFCDEMINILDKKDGFSVPSNLQGMLYVEDPKETFHVSRYYLTAREKEIADHIVKMSKAVDKLADLDIRYLNSTILYGESGTGKTTFGRYIAYIMGLPFYYMNFSKIINSYLGGTQQNISQIFAYLGQTKCVFMMDELDAIGMKRGSSKEVGELSRIVIGLMQELDRVSTNSIILAATNRIDIIDPALLRRFTIRHEVKRIDQEERYEMAKTFFQDIGLNVDEATLDTLAEPDDTQAGLMDQIILFLINSFSNGDLKGVE